MKRFRINVGLSSAAVMLLLLLYYSFLDPLLGKVGRSASLAVIGTVAAGFLVWLKWLAEDEIRDTLRRLLRLKRTTSWIAAVIAVTIALGGLLAWQKPFVVRLLPGKTLIGLLGKPEETTPRTPYSLKVWIGERAGEPAWKIADLRKSGALFGASRWEMEAYVRNERRDLDVKFQRHLQTQDIQEDFHDAYMAFWKSRPQYATGRRLLAETRLVIELYRKDEMEPFATRVVTLKGERGARIQTVFLERGHG